MTESPGIFDNIGLKRFEMGVGDEVAFLKYRRDQEGLHLLHTEVPDASRGSGVGTRLVRRVLDKARAEGAVVVPHCPFVQAYLKKHPEYEPLTRQRGS